MGRATSEATAVILYYGGRPGLRTGDRVPLPGDDERDGGCVKYRDRRVTRRSKIYAPRNAVLVTPLLRYAEAFARGYGLTHPEPGYGALYRVVAPFPVPADPQGWERHARDAFVRDVINPHIGPDDLLEFYPARYPDPFRSTSEERAPLMAWRIGAPLEQARRAAVVLSQRGDPWKMRADLRVDPLAPGR